MLLVDCGEGTQIPLKICGWGFKAIDAILFTHYHADHVAGLPGLLLTIGNSGREEPLTLIGPPGLRDVVEGLLIISPRLPFDLKLLELPRQQISEFDIDGVRVKSIPVDHWMPCIAYSFVIDRLGRFDINKAHELEIPIKYWKRLQKGEFIHLGDRVIKPSMVLGEPRKGLKVSYCTDTRPIEGLVDFIRDSDLFICEGMYGDNEDLQKAIEKRHMLFSEAATLAKLGQVKELWLTHYSPALENPMEYVTSAKSVFENTIAGCDLMTKSLRFSE